MRVVTVTELRNNLPAFLAAVHGGEELGIMSRGKVVARIVPESSEVDAARERLHALRSSVCLGDVMTSVW